MSSLFLFMPTNAEYLILDRIKHWIEATHPIPVTPPLPAAPQDLPWLNWGSQWGGRPQWTIQANEAREIGFPIVEVHKPSEPCPPPSPSCLVLTSAIQVDPPTPFQVGPGPPPTRNGAVRRRGRSLRCCRQRLGLRC